MANTSNIARGVEEGWLHENVTRAAERRDRREVKVNTRDRVLTTEDVPAAEALAMLAAEGMTVAPFSDRGWVKGKGHQTGCRADHRVRSCGAAGHWHEPANVGPVREDGTRSFRCGGCQSYALYDIPLAAEKTGRLVMAHRAHMVARHILTEANGTKVWHPTVVRWRCQTCHAQHGDGTVIVPADGPDLGPYGPTV